MRIESVRRWLDIILLTAVAVAVVVLIHIPVGNLAAATMGDLSLWWVRVIDLIASTGFLLWLGHIGAIRISHLRYGFDYPPTFFAGLVGTVVLAVAAPRSMRLADNHLSVDVSFDACALMALSAVIYAFVRWINSDARPAIRPVIEPTMTDNARDVTPGDRDDVVKRLLTSGWIDREEPIDDARNDLLDMQRVAQRVVARLKGAPLKSYALVGPYGCGKTSAKNLILKLIGPEPWTCEVDAWGLTEQGAATFILERILEEVGDHVDCLALRSIPIHYQNALKAARAPGTTLLGAITERPKDPLVTLSLVDDVLQAVKQRIVVFIEDADRNAGDSGAIEEMSALLDRLRKLKNISFVLTVGLPGEGGIDLPKLCDYVESLPVLTTKQVNRVVSRFREERLAQFPDDIQLNVNERRAMSPGLMRMFQQEDEISDETKAVSRILNTPRLLKLALRHARESWGVLHGEIAFDDLFIICALRAAAPHVYSYLALNVDEIRYNALGDSFRRILNDSDAEKVRKEGRVAIEKAVERYAIQSCADAVAVRALVSYILPSVPDSGHPSRGALQRVFVAYPTDYWRRALSEDCGPQPLDQEFLKKFDLWKVIGDPGFAVKLATDTQWAEKVEQFNHLLPTEKIHSLARQIFRLALAATGASTDHESVVGFIPLWRIAISRQTVQSSLEFAWEEFKHSLTISLRFAVDVLYYWGSASPTINILTAKESTRLQKRVRGYAHRVLKDANILIKAIDGGTPFTLANFIFQNQNAFAGELSRWHWIGDILLSATEINPHLMVPQLVFLVGSSVDGWNAKNTARIRTAKIEEVVVNGLWPLPAQQDRLWRCLSLQIDRYMYEEFAGEAVALIPAVQEIARERVRAQSGAALQNDGVPE